MFFIFSWLYVLGNMLALVVEGETTTESGQVSHLPILLVVEGETTTGSGQVNHTPLFPLLPCAASLPLPLSLHTLAHPPAVRPSQLISFNLNRVPITCSYS